MRTIYRDGIQPNSAEGTTPRLELSSSRFVIRATSSLVSSNTVETAGSRCCACHHEQRRVQRTIFEHNLQQDKMA